MFSCVFSILALTFNLSTPACLLVVLLKKVLRLNMYRALSLVYVYHRRIQRVTDVFTITVF